MKRFAIIFYLLLAGAVFAQGNYDRQGRLGHKNRHIVLADTIQGLTGDVIVVNDSMKFDGPTVFSDTATFNQPVVFSDTVHINSVVDEKMFVLSDGDTIMIDPSNTKAIQSGGSFSGRFNGLMAWAFDSTGQQVLKSRLVIGDTMVNVPNLQAALTVTGTYQYGGINNYTNGDTVKLWTDVGTALGGTTDVDGDSGVTIIGPNFKLGADNSFTIGIVQWDVAGKDSINGASIDRQSIPWTSIDSTNYATDYDMSLKMNSADFGDSLDAYDGFGIIVTDNDDMEVDTSAIPTDYDLGLKQNALDFGDSLVAYDGFGITVTDNDDFEVDTSAIPTDYDIGLKLNSLDFGDSLAAYDGFGIIVTDNDDFEVDTSAIPTDYDLGLKLAIADSGTTYPSVYTDGLKLLASAFGDSLLAYDGFGLTVTDNDDIEVDTSQVPTDYDLGLKLNSADFGDSLDAYDGFGVTVTDNDIIEVDTAAIPTDYDLSLKAPLASPTFTGTVGAAAIAATGQITGLAPMSLDSGGPITLSSDSCMGNIHFNNAASVLDYTLPAAAAGLTVMFYDIGGGVITIDPVDGADTIYLDGTSVGAGDAIDSPGVVGNFICLMALDGTRWVTIGRSGTWVDGGAD